MTTMSIVWDADDDGRRLGDTSEHFIALWGDADGNAQAVFCHPAEWQPLADAIEKLLEDFQPTRPVFEWPRVEPREDE